jgi:hypothetical protein
MKTLTELLSFFEHGDIPTQSQFEELIRTMFELFAAAQETANSAVTTANVALAAGPKALLKFTVSTETIVADTNVDSVVLFSSTPTSRTFDITFTVPLPNANYVVLLGGPPTEQGTTGVLNGVARVVSQSTTVARVTTGTTGTLFMVCI